MVGMLSLAEHSSAQRETMVAMILSGMLRPMEDGKQRLQAHQLLIMHLAEGGRRREIYKHFYANIGCRCVERPAHTNITIPTIC